MKLKWTLCVALALILLVWVAACSSSPPKPNPLLNKPTVNCNEHAPLSRLAPVPVPDKAVDAVPPDDASTADTIDDLRAELAATRKYAGAEAVWATQTAGVVREDEITYQAVGACLDRLRQAGVIQ